MSTSKFSKICANPWKALVHEGSLVISSLSQVRSRLPYLSKVHSNSERTPLSAPGTLLHPKFVLTSDNVFVPSATVCHMSTKLKLSDVSAALDRGVRRHEELCKALRGVMRDLNEIVERAGRVVEEGMAAGWCPSGGGGVGGGKGNGGSREFEAILDAYGMMGRELFRKQCMADALLSNTEGLFERPRTVEDAVQGEGDESDERGGRGSVEVAAAVDRSWGDDAESSLMDTELLERVAEWSS